MNIRPHDVPRFLMACAVAIAVLHTCAMLVGCSAPQTHQSIETTAYAADDGVCVTEATDRDGGVQCLDKYKRLYSVFWADSGTTVCEVAVKDGGQ